MKRMGFLTGLLGYIGVASAQKWATPIIDENHFLTGRTKAKLNGQCPVCGTIAPAFHGDEAIRRYVAKHPELMVGRSPIQQNLERCSRCDNAFYQDEVKV